MKALAAEGKKAAARRFLITIAQAWLLCSMPESAHIFKPDRAGTGQNGNFLPERQIFAGICKMNSGISFIFHTF